FSSRRRHTRVSRDWSSDVCSSDLNEQACEQGKCERGPREGPWPSTSPNRRGRGNSGENEERVRGLSLRRRAYPLACSSRTNFARSEERRVGDGERCRWQPYQ